MIARLAAVAAVILAIAAAPRVVEAHAEHERSNPAPGSVIPRAPETLEIWFTQELFRRAGANTITLEGPDGIVEVGEAVIDDADREHLTVALPPDLPAGQYEVSWTSLSAIDGDAAEGNFSFTIDPSAPEPTPPVETPEATPTPSATSTAEPSPAATDSAPEGEDDPLLPTWVLIAAAAIVGSAALGAWALLRGEDGSTEG